MSDKKTPEEENEELRRRLAVLEEKTASNERVEGGCFPYIGYLSASFLVIVGGVAAFLRHTEKWSWDQAIFTGVLIYCVFFALGFAFWLWERHKAIAIGIIVVLILIGTIRRCISG